MRRRLRRAVTIENLSDLIMAIAFDLVRKHDRLTGALRNKTLPADARAHHVVMPAKAGIQVTSPRGDAGRLRRALAASRLTAHAPGCEVYWVPAFAGTTQVERWRPIRALSAALAVQQPWTYNSYRSGSGSLMATIRRLAAAGAYSFSQHAFDERMVERGFDIDDVLKIMEQGEIDGPIAAGRRDGEWRCTVVGKLPWTSREAGVVTVVVRESRLIFVTVGWMDP